MMKLSDKFNGIYELIEVDNKDAIVQEIKALKNFTDTELATIFGSANILWILENFTVKELKEKVKRVESGIEAHVGDIIKFKNREVSIVGVILEITGLLKDRCTALCFYQEEGYFKVVEGISYFDIEVVSSNDCDRTFNGVISMLNTKSGNFTTVSREGDL